MEGKLLASDPAVYAGLRPALRMAKRKHITIRPRVNSALERIHEEQRKEFPNLVHSWAEQAEAFSMEKEGEEKNDTTD